MNDALAKSAAERTRVGDRTQPAVSSDLSFPPIERPRASFEPVAMQHFLDGEHRPVRELVKQIVKRVQSHAPEGGGPNGLGLI